MWRASYNLRETAGQWATASHTEQGGGRDVAAQRLVQLLRHRGRRRRRADRPDLRGDLPHRGVSGGGLGTYSTPTVVHFAAVLLSCATLSAPWPTLAPVALLLGLGGLGGTAYVAIV